MRWEEEKLMGEKFARSIKYAVTTTCTEAETRGNPQTRGIGGKGSGRADWGLEKHAVELRQWLKGCRWIKTRG